MNSHRDEFDESLDKAMSGYRPLAFPAYYQGQRLDADLLNAESAAFRRWGAYFGRLAAGVGILDGLELEVVQGDQEPAVVIRAGAAIDTLGRFILVSTDRVLDKQKLTQACQEHGESFAVWLCFVIHTRPASSGPVDQRTFGSTIRFSRQAASQTSSREFPEQTFGTFAQCSPPRRESAVAGICLGVIQVVREQKGGDISIAGVGDTGRDITLASLESLSRYLLLRQRHARMVLPQVPVRSFGRLPTPAVEIALLDSHNHPVTNEPVVMSVVAKGLFAEVVHAGSWTGVNHTIETETDGQGKLSLRFLADSPGAYAAHVHVEFRSQTIQAPPPVTIPVRVEHMLQTVNPSPLRGFVGERVKLEVQFHDKSPEGMCVHVTDPLEYRLFSEAQPIHEKPRRFQVFWRIRRVGSHSVTAVANRAPVAQSELIAKARTIDSMSIPLIGELTRVVILSGNAQRGAPSATLRHPVVIRVERMNGEPVENARIQLSSSGFDTQMLDGIEFLDDAGVTEEGQRFGRTDKQGRLRFWWAPPGLGLQALAVRHVADSRDHDQTDFPQISVADVFVSAQCKE